MLDRISVRITTDMIGTNREVKVISSGYSTLGAAINVYAEGGEGSFANSLTNQFIKQLDDSRNKFLYCINGKGDIYYCSPGSKKIFHVLKDGTTSELFDLATAVLPGNVGVAEFIAGGVSPNGTELYFSASTLSGDYIFAKLNLASKLVTVLNQSQILAAPYEGNVSQTQLVVSGIYPDDKGNVFLGLGFNTGRDGSYIPGAVALYNTADNGINYLFKEFSFAKGYTNMPGTVLNLGFALEFRFSAVEGLLYLMQTSFRGADAGAIIDVYDLTTRTKLQTLTTANTTGGASALNVLAPFTSLSIPLTFNTPESSFGFLPVPGRRLQVLLYQQVDNSVSQANEKDFPRWITFDFAGERTYAYAPGRFRLGDYDFRRLGIDLKDELLNYDQAGNLYTTANGRTMLIRTKSL